MHILIIPSWYPSIDNPNYGIFFREQAQALSNFGHQVGVIYPQRISLRFFNRNSKVLRQDYIYNDEDIPTFLSYGWSWRIRNPEAYVKLLCNDGIDLFKKYSVIHGVPDIIHAHSALFGGVIASEISDKYSIPFVFTEHATAYARHLIQPWQYKYLNRVYSHTKKTITVSPELGSLLVKEYGCPSESIKYIPNMVNVDRFAIKEIQKESFIFFNLASLDEKKGHSYLLRSFAQKFKGLANILLWIGGDGPERYSLEKQAEELGILNQVKFMGSLNRDEVKEVMQICDVFVLPSLYETFGVVVIEALACGKPVVATVCGGPECIVDSSNGYLVPKADVNALAESMDMALRNIKSFDSISIRQGCIERFSEEAVSKTLTNVYQHILNRS